MRFPRTTLIALLALALAALACNAFGAGDAPTDVVAESTEPVGAPVGGQPTVTPGVPALVPTATTGVVQPTPVTPTATTPCNYNAVYVSDITIPDDTPIVAGQNFTKTWRIRNNGCQTWPTGTTLVYINEAQMGGPASVSVPQTAPEGTQDISVNLIAPAAPGTYRGNWRLKTPDGVLFGDTIYVRILSVAPTPTATATLPPAAVIEVKFNAGYAGLWKCSDNNVWMMSFKIDNTGTTTIEHVQFTSSLGGGSQNRPFRPVPPYADCANFGSESLAGGSAAWVSLPVGTTNPGSGSGSVTIKACSANDGGGVCKNTTVNFNY